MDKILSAIKNIITENIHTYLPNVKPEELEENGAIYYMNEQNGTGWDWYVNEHVSDFMVFYNDEDNLGAVKLRLYTNGSVTLHLYGEKGKTLFKALETNINAREDEILKLAVLLKKEMDDKNNWNANIAKINTDIVTEEDINNFKDNEKDFESAQSRANILNKMAYVSKKILDENYKIGYMHRDEPLNDNDSGWSFLAGNEDDEYSEDPDNVELLSLKQVHQMDPNIWKYIDSPVGSEFIRVSSNEFEKYTEDKEIYIEKR